MARYYSEARAFRWKKWNNRSNGIWKISNNSDGALITVGRSIAMSRQLGEFRNLFIPTAGFLGKPRRNVTKQGKTVVPDINEILSVRMTDKRAESSTLRLSLHCHRYHRHALPFSSFFPPALSTLFSPLARWRFVRYQRCLNTLRRASSRKEWILVRNPGKFVTGKPWEGVPANSR